LVSTRSRSYPLTDNGADFFLLHLVHLLGVVAAVVDLFSGIETDAITQFSYWP